MALRLLFLGLFLAALAAPAAAQSDSGPFTGLSYRQIGPAISGGRSSAVAGSDRDPALYYAGGAGGGVFKSTDGGASWVPVFDKQPVAPIGAIAIAPQDDRDVWVGTGESNPRNTVESRRRRLSQHRRRKALAARRPRRLGAHFGNQHRSARPAHRRRRRARARFERLHRARYLHHARRRGALEAHALRRAFERRLVARARSRPAVNALCRHVANPPPALAARQRRPGGRHLSLR